MSARPPSEEPTEGKDTPAPESVPPPDPESGAQAPEGFWSTYWERFRRQQVDDPIEEKREGVWDRFRRQDVDDPVRRDRS